MIRGVRQLIASGLILVQGVILWSCSSDPSGGYSFTSSYRTDIETVAVPIFDNSTYSHGLEVLLTDAIVKQIHSSTPYRVVAEDRADTVLSGTITETDLRKLRTDPDSGLVQELAYEMAVTFEWKDARTGQVLASRRNFRSSESFVPNLVAQERLESGEVATIQQLARDLVSELRSSW